MRKNKIKAKKEKREEEDWTCRPAPDFGSGLNLSYI
jgi:hypothetical protein